MSRHLWAWLMLAALAACGEKAQVSDTAASRKSDEQAWAVSKTAEPAFAARGWQSSGDKAAWEQQIRQRGQAQNDYAR
ncbi:MAG: hypothetical protein ABI702_11165 [Burkholderiales bacterium]